MIMMTKLIEKNDSRYFSQTSDEPYDRHHYKIVSKHYATFIVESWDEVQEWWWNCLLYTSPSPRDLSTSRMPSSA